MCICGLAFLNVNLIRIGDDINRIKTNFFTPVASYTAGCMVVLLFFTETRSTINDGWKMALPALLVAGSSVGVTGLVPYGNGPRRSAALVCDRRRDRGLAERTGPSARFNQLVLSVRERSASRLSTKSNGLPSILETELPELG